MKIPSMYNIGKYARTLREKKLRQYELNWIGWFGCFSGGISNISERDDNEIAHLLKSSPCYLPF